MRRGLTLFLATWLVLTICSLDLARADTGFGISTPNSLSWADNKYGHIDVYRKYFPGLPKQIPNRSAAISFKAQPGAVVNGQHDRYLRNWFRNLPNRPTVYWTFWHEPQNFGTAAQARLYKRAWRHITAIERNTPTNGNLRATYIDHMNSVWSGTWNKWYPGNKSIDVIAFDGKIKTWNHRYIPAKRHYGEGLRIARRHGKPFALAEYGATILPGYNARDRARWMRQTAHWLSNVGARFACWWDQNSTAAGGPGAKAGDFRLRDRPSIKAMKWMLRSRWQ